MKFKFKLLPKTFCSKMNLRARKVEFFVNREDHEKIENGNILT